MQLYVDEVSDKDIVATIHDPLANDYSNQCK